jgi:hypothetical protein
MNCMRFANACSRTLVGHLMHWLIGSKPKNSSQIVHASNHDENGAPEP